MPLPRVRPHRPPRRAAPARRRPRRRRRPPRRTAAVVLVAVVWVVIGAASPGGAGPVAAGSPPNRATGQVPPPTGTYRPPVDAPVIDPFRPPPHPYGPGNRGLTYAVAPLTPVRAVGDGEVVFAGAVGGALHVTIRHGDGLRTSYSYLAALAVGAGTRVATGAVIGWSTEVLHLGLRTPDGTYLDPALLWSGRWEPRLVPGGDDGAPVPPEPVALLDVVRERSGPLASWVATGGASLTEVGAGTVAAFDRRLRIWEHYAEELQPAVHARRLTEGLDRWQRERRDCTPAEAVVAPPTARRIVVEVGGIGSTSEHAAITRLDTDALGYDEADVIRFSYGGGRVPPATDGAGGERLDPFGTVTTTPYDAAASQGDIAESGRRLAALLDEVARAAPGVPIDVVAHSQGGVVSRLALAHAQRTGALPAEVQTLVTLGSPHQGADIATAIEAVRADPAGATALDAARAHLGIELDPGLPAAGQLSEVAPVIVQLETLPPPEGVRFTSIAARGDLVVPAGRTAAPGARQRTVSISGVSAHDQLPGSVAATREVLLAVGGRPPSCRALHDVLVDLAVSDGIGLLEDTLGAHAAGAALVAPG